MGYKSKFFNSGKYSLTPVDTNNEEKKYKSNFFNSGKYDVTERVQVDTSNAGAARLQASMPTVEFNTTRLKALEPTTTTNSQVSIGPVNRFNSGLTAMEHDQSSNYKAPAKYTYESVQDRINNYQADFDKIVKRYGAKQDKDGTWTFYTQKGLDAANRLQQEMEAALTDYNGYYSSADYVKKLANESAKTKAATESELAEAREQVEKAQSNGWTLTLYPVVNGNLDTDVIDVSVF